VGEAGRVGEPEGEGEAGGTVTWGEGIRVAVGRGDEGERVLQKTITFKATMRISRAESTP
jgi:hypothetical protein